MHRLQAVIGLMTQWTSFNFSHTELWCLPMWTVRNETSSDVMSLVTFMISQLYIEFSSWIVIYFLAEREESKTKAKFLNNHNFPMAEKLLFFLLSPTRLVYKWALRSFFVRVAENSIDYRTFFSEIKKLIRAFLTFGLVLASMSITECFEHALHYLSNQ